MNGEPGAYAPASAYPGGDSDRGSVVALVEGGEDPCSVDRV